MKFSALALLIMTGCVGVISGPDATEISDIRGDSNEILTFETQQGFPGICDGSYKITNATELEEISDCIEITGNLTITSESLESLTLPSLVSVWENIEISDNPILESVDFPVLSELDAGSSTVYLIDNPLLKVISFPQLSKCNALGIFGNQSVTSVQFPNLEICLDVRVRSNPSLIIMSFPVLERAIQLVLADNKRLIAAYLPEFRNGVIVSFSNNPVLHILELPTLEQVSVRLELKSCDVLPSISAPKLAAIHSLSIQENDSLANIDFRSLVLVTDFLGKDGSMYFSNNPSLATCLIKSLYGQVHGTPGNEVEFYEVWNNDDCECEDIEGITQATCP